MIWQCAYKISTFCPPEKEVPPLEDKSITHGLCEPCSRILSKDASLFTVKEAADYLKIGVSSMRRFTALYKISHVKFDRIIRFRKRDLEKFMRSRQIQTVT